MFGKRARLLGVPVIPVQAPPFCLAHAAIYGILGPMADLDKAWEVECALADYRHIAIITNPWTAPWKLGSVGALCGVFLARAYVCRELSHTGLPATLPESTCVRCIKAHTRRAAGLRLRHQPARMWLVRRSPDP